MQKAVRYQSEVKTVPFGNCTITIENRTPILSSEERTARKREIELVLYAVLKKYAEIQD